MIQGKDQTHTDTFGFPAVESTDIEFSNIDSSLREAIHGLVKTDLVLSTELMERLKQEREVLQERKFDAMMPLVESKEKTLKQLDKNTQQRQQLLLQAGITVNDSQWNQFIESINDSELKESWSELLTVLSECRQENSVNGKMIARGQQTMGRLLNILRGQVGIPELYDQSGSTTNDKNSRTCVKI